MMQGILISDRNDALCYTGTKLISAVTNLQRLLSHTLTKPHFNLVGKKQIEKKKKKKRNFCQVLILPTASLTTKLVLPTSRNDTTHCKLNFPNSLDPFTKRSVNKTN
jgi:hypothetical protein